MALPDTITTTGVDAYILGNGGRPNCFDRKSYVTLTDGTALEMWSSLEPGVAAWAELDAAGHPTTAGRWVGSVIAKGMMNFITQPDGSTGSVRVHEFNAGFTLEVWGNVDIEVENITNNNVINTHPFIADGERGDFHVIYQTARSKIMGVDFARVGYSISTNDMADWSTPVEVNVTDEEFDHRTMELLLGVDGTAHIFYARRGVSSGDERMFQRAVDNAGTLQTERIDVDGSNTYYFGTSVTRVMAGVEVFNRGGTDICRAIYKGTSNASLLSIEFDAVADPSSFTTAVVQDDALNSGRNNWDIALIDDKQFVVYSDVNTDYEDDSATDTWTGSATQLNAVSIMQLNAAVIIRDGVARLAVVYGDASDDPIYDEVDLSDVAPTNLSDCDFPEDGSFLGPFEL